MADCLAPVPRSWATVGKGPAHQPFLPEHIDWFGDQNHHLCQGSESAQQTADSCLLLEYRKLVVVTDGWLPMADVTRLPDSSNALHAMHTDQLDLMP